MKDKILQFINFSGKYLTSLLILLTLSLTQMWAADDIYYVAMVQNVAEDGTLSGTSGTLKVVKYTASTGKYAETNAVSWSLNNPSVGCKGSSVSKCSDIADYSKWQQGSGSQKAKGPQFSGTTTLSLGSLTATKITFIGYRNNSGSGGTLQVGSGDAKTTVKRPSSTFGSDCVVEYTGSFTGNVSVVASDVHCGVFVITVPAGFSVTYVENGHGANQTDLTGQTKLPATLPTLSETGWIFGGWFTDNGTFETPAVAGATLSANATLYAKWTEDTSVTKYEVTYNLGGASGTAPTQEDVAEGTVITLAAAPSWAGHAFDGWLCNIDSDVKAAGSSYTMTAAPTTFTAQWHELECKIYSFTGGIGSATAQTANATVDADKMFVKDSGDKIRLTPATGESFKVGDILTFSGNLNNLSKKFGLKLYANGGSSVSQTIENAVGTEPLICSAALTFNADYFDVSRADGTGTTLYTMEVHRACAEGIAAGLSFAETEIDKTEGDAAFTNTLTNPNGLVIAGYKSSNTAVATVATNGQVTVVGPGSATITANSAVQTKAGTLYAAGTASYTLTVAACTPPRTPEFATTNPVVVTKNSATATWDVNGADASVAKYQVSVVKKSDASVVLDWTDCVYANPCTYTATKLDPETEYTFKLRSVGAAGYCALSDVVTEDFTTLEDLADKYTVIFKDGDVTLDTKQFDVTTNPSDADIEKTKPLYAFAAWQLSGSDIALDDASWTSVAANAEVTLTARWTKLYASSYDMEAYAVSEGASKSGIEAALTAANYAYTNINDIDNGHTHNYTYDGLKYKTNDGDLSFNVVAGKVVEVKTGHLPSNDAVTMYINGTANATVFEGADENTETHKMNYFYSAVEALYRLDVKASKGTCAVKAVTIRDPYTVSFEAHGDADPGNLPGQPSVTLPNATNGTASLLGWFDAETGGNKIGNAGATYTPTASITLHAQWETVSSDNTLSDLKVGGVTVDGFDPAVHTYYVVLPYGTAAGDIPAISATANSAKAKQVAIEQAVWTGDPYNCYRAQANVQAEDESWGYYDVRFSFAPKDGAVIFKAELTSATAATYSGLFADGANSEIKLSDDGANGYKFGGGSNYIKMALSGGSFATGDLLTMTYSKNPQQGELAIYENTTKLAGTEYTNNTLEFPEEANGLSTLYIRRTSDNTFNGWVTVVEVTRVIMPTLTAITFDGEAATKGTGNAFSVTLPEEGTNLASMTIVPTIMRNAAHATTPEAVISNEGAWKEGENTYRVMDKDGDYSDYTITITLQGTAETPVITADPASQAYCAGSEPTLTVAANAPSDGGTLHYAWFKEAGADDEAVGTDAASYTVEAAGTYYVIVTNKKEGKLDSSVTSENAVVTLNVAAAITTQPKNKRDIVSGSEVTLSVVATNATGYQWYICDDAEKANASAISGAESADYVFNCSANAYYYCVVGNACGDAIASNVVSVKLEPANCGTLASIPSAAPYQYEQTGEWTLYATNGNGRIDGTTRFVDNAKDFNDHTVNAITTTSNGIGMIFAKDIVSLTFYATSTSTGRTINSISVTEDDITSGTPTYTAVTADLATATMEGYNKQYIFTVDNTLLEAGKKYRLFFSGSVTIFKICYTEAPAKCDAPVLPTLDDKELCQGDAFTAWDATSTVSDGGTLSYRWYNGDTDVAIENADDAEFTPSVDGNYYVIVTNKLTGYRDNTTKSATLSVEHFASAVITSAPEDQRLDVGANATLTVVASGKAPLGYQWYTCDNADGDNPVIIAGAESDSYSVEVTAGMNQYYKVVVTSGCGSASAVAKVEEWVELPQLNVSKTTVWDWENAGENIKLTDETTPMKNEECVMANVKVDGKQPTNNETFNSQALVFYGENVRAKDGGRYYASVGHIKFNVNVPGKVTVEFSDNGTNNRKVKINDAVSESSSSKTDVKTFSAVVPAGEVTLMGVKEDGTGSNQYIRISKITFNITDVEGADYTRAVTAGRYGTICLPNGGVMVGAALYEVAYFGGTSKKIFFDEIINGTMEAGVPYIFLPREGASQLGVFYTDAANAEAGHKNGLYGSYTQEELAQDGTNYILINNQYCLVDSKAYVGENRAYIKLGEITHVEPTLAPGRRRVAMDVQGYQVPTDIDNLNAGETPMKVMINGQMYILRGEKMYDATGRLVK